MTVGGADSGSSAASPQDDSAVDVSGGKEPGVLRCRHVDDRRAVALESHLLEAVQVDDMDGAVLAGGGDEAGPPRAAGAAPGRRDVAAPQGQELVGIVQPLQDREVRHLGVCLQDAYRAIHHVGDDERRQSVRAGCHNKASKCCLAADPLLADDAQTVRIHVKGMYVTAAGSGQQPRAVEGEHQRASIVVKSHLLLPRVALVGDEPKHCPSICHNHGPVRSGHGQCANHQRGVHEAVLQRAVLDKPYPNMPIRGSGHQLKAPHTEGHGCDGLGVGDELLLYLYGRRGVRAVIGNCKVLALVGGLPHAVHGERPTLGGRRQEPAPLVGRGLRKGEDGDGGTRLLAAQGRRSGGDLLPLPDLAGAQLPGALQRRAEELERARRRRDPVRPRLASHQVCDALPDGTWLVQHQAPPPILLVREVGKPDPLSSGSGYRSQLWRERQ
eukprot:CAMPEP_0175205120 /NCGR_PEP_ID=MMETSP0093-20121207/11924_1 /TAXON_ID=311494 /ORGANISM="Alexandrium monilatum, Strain CCMP3105" /LENGTH=440 /DNA_ID=CAMNT_0016498225 /DNA_START=96 /DNA_END=1415 /DNA_ORIENTATION=-